MNKKNTKIQPVVPYSMDNASSVRGFNSRYGGYYGGGYYGGYGPYGYRGYAIPDRNTVKDFNSSRYMAGNRTKVWNPFFFRWETQLTDMRTASVERDKKGRPVRKVIHTPYIMTEEYITQWDLFWKLWAYKLISLSIIAILVVVIVVLLITLL